MELNSLRQILLRSVVHVVAREGLVKATTKAIAAEAGVNEVYIYRCFKNKEDLLSTAFLQEDRGFERLLRLTLSDLRRQELPWRDKAFFLWKASWEFILGKPDDCTFYLRYYYSANCRKYSYERHLECFHPLIDYVAPRFRDGTNVDMLVHQIFDTMLSFAARVLNGEYPNNDATTRETFEQIYSFVVPNVLPEVLEEKSVESRR